MKTDRELLELAAKAYGIKHIKWNDHPKEGRLGGWLSDGKNTWWNPLTDDGDALRLAVKLGMDINAYPATGEVAAVQHRAKDSYSRCIERVGVDKFAATRRAIVRAAAAIGEAMP